MKLPIYLDNHSTTRTDKRVIEAMLPYFDEYYGNPSSMSHPYGWAASSAVESAREKVADFIGAKPEEIIFTSGTTESNNLALKGLALSPLNKKRHIVTTEAEHPSVLNVVRFLERSGFLVTYLKLDQYGMFDPGEFEGAIKDDTLMVSLMAANNEIGTIYPLSEIAAICQKKGVLFHTDAAQAIGKMDFNVSSIALDMASFSAHKNYGPRGTGALYVRQKSPKIRLTPLLQGGGQEKDLRSGTLNTPAIVGFAKSLEISKEEMPVETERIRLLRDRLKEGIFRALDDIYLNGHPEKRLVNNLNISIKNINIDHLLSELRDLALSTGSACASGSPEGSHVLKAIGLDQSLMKASVRFGLGRFNTEEEIDYTISRFTGAVKKVRNKNL
ncbi:MAG: cysteine desulfurase family protein [Bacteroidota bacterium]|jgi:cysteine desulfurase|nr:cysteine desulfurase [Ignavibacteria bacterium]MCU7500349.1 cysteine desulfurase [Ignavibacteria bacterium]MCU7511889.1 cysteine desulfurase [Ignavibacteria bacterium]MCU7519910.1 cysteine desulfurase [Ignavibacteria bacterium]MCU7522985.1 cysteine desulfurase [Ignavibacteria bacterium]